MTGRDTAAVAVGSDPAGSVAAWAAAAAAPVNSPGAGLTMLGSVDGGDACADGSCAIPTVDPAG